MVHKTRYGYFLVIDTEGEGVIGQVSTQEEAESIASRSERRNHRNCIIARDVKR